MLSESSPLTVHTANPPVFQIPLAMDVKVAALAQTAAVSKSIVIIVFIISKF